MIAVPHYEMQLSLTGLVVEDSTFRQDPVSGLESAPAGGLWVTFKSQKQRSRQAGTHHLTRAQRAWMNREFYAEALMAGDQPDVLLESLSDTEISCFSLYLFW